MGCFLKDRDRVQLSYWLGKDCHFKLLYKISRDGGTPQTFHNLCDNKGPTVTIFYNTDNNVYGGYTSLCWDSSNTWYKDESSFLFQLYCNRIWKPNMFTTNEVSLRKTTTNVLSMPTYGPTFEDLPSFNIKIEKNLNQYNMGTTSLFSGRFYNTGSEDMKSITNGHNNVTDLEVYMVEGNSHTDYFLWRTYSQSSAHWSYKVFMGSLF